MKKISKKAVLLFAILVFLFSISFEEVEAQSWGCADQQGGCNGGWTTQNLTYTIPNTNCIISCNYRFRVCNGVFQWEYTNVTSTGNCTFMQNFNYLHYSFSSVNELLDMLILSDFNDNQVIRNCENGTTNTAMFYSAACGIWLSCEYDIAPQTPRCEQGYDDVPAPGPTTVKTWKWQPCGVTCCQRVYNICNQLNPVTNVRTTIINAMTKTKIGNCTQEPGGSAPKYAKPCEDGC